MDPIKKEEQPNTDSDLENGQPLGANPDDADLFTVKVNGEEKQVTRDELINGYMRQSDYTKKTTELSEEKRKVLEGMWLSEEDITDLKNFKDSVLSEKQQAEKDKKFNEFTSQFSSLTDSQKKILKDLSSTQPDKELQELVVEYWMIDQSLIEKSKWGNAIKGDSPFLPKEEEKPKIDPTIARRYNIKPKGEIDNIKAKMGL